MRTLYKPEPVSTKGHAVMVGQDSNWRLPFNGNPVCRHCGYQIDPFNANGENVYIVAGKLALGHEPCPHRED